MNGSRRKTIMYLMRRKTIMYSPVEFMLIWTPEEKLEPPDVLPSDALGFCTTIIGDKSITKAAAAIRRIFKEDLESIARIRRGVAAEKTLKEKSEPPDALPSYALGSAVLDKEVYSSVEFMLIRTSEEKSKSPDAFPSNALSSADAEERIKGKKKGKGEKKKKNKN
ncbi:hypothetical protein Q3G72_029331 [Acer saccharum]|nr:hypothetical protein Q3G72_029331 [Acer saccharum]